MRAITLEVVLRTVVGVRDEDRSEQLRSVLPGVLAVNLMSLFAEGRVPGAGETRAGVAPLE